MHNPSCEGSFLDWRALEKILPVTRGSACCCAVAWLSSDFLQLCGCAVGARAKELFGLALAGKNRTRSEGRAQHLPPNLCELQCNSYKFPVVGCVCWLLFVVCCLLFVVWCLMFDVWCLLFVVCWLLLVLGCLLFVVRCWFLLFVVRCLLFVVRCSLFVVCCCLCFACRFVGCLVCLFFACFFVVVCGLLVGLLVAWLVCLFWGCFFVIVVVVLVVAALGAGRALKI